MTNSMTNTTELKALTMLRSAELTSDMESDHLKTLAALATEVEFKENELIYEQGTTGEAIYLIKEGEVVLETKAPNDGPLTMNTLGPGQFFGWSSLFPDERKMAWTRATKPTRAFAIDAGQVRAAWRDDPTLEYSLVRRVGKDLADRIKAARHQLVKMMEQG